MSLLPQRKKSAGEIAKLRETLGIPGQAPAAEELTLLDAKGQPHASFAAGISPEAPIFEAPTPAVHSGALLAPLPQCTAASPTPCPLVKALGAHSGVTDGGARVN